MEWYSKYHYEWNISNRDSIKTRKAEYYLSNRDKYASRVARRRADVLDRTPPWYGEFDDLVYLNLVEKRRELEDITGTKFHIDHIVPIKGKLVSGLHCHSNWQLLPASTNLSKSNKWRIN